MKHFSIAAALLVALPTSQAAAALTFEWGVQSPGSDNDSITQLSSIDADGNVYFATSPTPEDVLLTKHSPHGTMLWQQNYRSSGVSSRISPTGGVEVDSQGRVYVAGDLDDLSSDPEEHGFFLMRYDSEGSFDWLKSFAEGPETRTLHALAIDHNDNLLIAGQTRGPTFGANAGNNDVFLAKYSSDGVQQWSTQFGTGVNESARAVAATATGEVFIAGTAGGDLQRPSSGRNDGFLAKYSADGAHLWTKQVGGHATDFFLDVVADGSGGAFVVGSTNSHLAGANAGLSDAYVARFDSEGDQLWSRQFGSNAVEDLRGIATDGKGALYLSGHTNGDLFGVSSGSRDVILAKLDTDGNPLWLEQFGSPEFDRGRNIRVDSEGGIYVSGFTQGSLYGLTGGPSFLLRFSQPVPEPAAGLLAGLSWTAAAGLRRTRRSR